MKVYFTILLMILGVANLSAQSFYKQRNQRSAMSVTASSFTTRSIRGWKTGVSAGIGYKDRMEVGYYYLSSVGEATASKVHHGGNVSYIFNPYKKFQVLAGLNLGLFDNQFVALLPELSMRWNVNQRVAIQSGISRSDGYPFFSLKANVKLISF
ncbi:hypothetical protein [Roseivirga pacifica]